MPEFEFKTIDTVVHRPSSDWKLWIYLPLIEANYLQMSLQCLNTAAATNSKLDYSRFLENKQTQKLVKLTFGLLIKLPNEISEVKRRLWKWNVIVQTVIWNSYLDSKLPSASWAALAFVRISSRILREKWKGVLR